MILEIPELTHVIGSRKVDALLRTTDDDYKEQLKACFFALMTCKQEIVTEALSALLKRLKDEGTK